MTKQLPYHLDIDRHARDARDRLSAALDTIRAADASPDEVGIYQHARDARRRLDAALGHLPDTRNS